jgi:cyclic pyranopterin monophosphate synthase
VNEEQAARMVDVTEKAVTLRIATAVCTVAMQPDTRGRLLDGTLPKGDALEVARIAGIMAAKRTSDLIPLCHPIRIGSIDVICLESDEGIDVTATVKTNERTGVEMEAMTAVAVAGLTVYDMIKSIDRAASISKVRLLEKSGGRSGDWKASD